MREQKGRERKQVEAILCFNEFSDTSLCLEREGGRAEESGREGAKRLPADRGALRCSAFLSSALCVKRSPALTALLGCFRTKVTALLGT